MIEVGVDSEEGPPVPIPNTVVKLISADNTWLEAAREDKAMPTQQRTTVTTVVFIFIQRFFLPHTRIKLYVIFILHLTIIN